MEGLERSIVYSRVVLCSSVSLDETPTTQTTVSACSLGAMYERASPLFCVWLIYRSASLGYYITLLLQPLPDPYILDDLPRSLRYLSSHFPAFKHVG